MTKLCAALILTAWLIPRCAGPTPPEQTMAAWGEEALGRIQTECWLPDRNIYADGGKPAFAWAAGVQLTALTAATRVEREKSVTQLKLYLDGLHQYWTLNHDIGGF